MEAKVYVGSYNKYNNGSIFGEWMDFSDYSDAGEFLEACKELHSDEDDVELMFQDYEGFPSELYGESMGEDDIQKIYDYLDVLNELDEVEQEAFESFISIYGLDVTEHDILDRFHDSYHGEWDSEEDFAQHLFDECYMHDVPESVRFYIDYEKFARDLFMDGFYYDDRFVFRLN